MKQSDADLPLYEERKEDRKLGEQRGLSSIPLFPHLFLLYFSRRREREGATAGLLYYFFSPLLLFYFSKEERKESSGTAGFLLSEMKEGRQRRHLPSSIPSSYLLFF
jgi:hypothetical protein